jgi:hypothetical protein
VAATRHRDLLWLAPIAAFAVGIAFFTAVYWAGTLELSEWLATSAFRVVDSLVLSATVGLALLVEQIARR